MSCPQFISSIRNTENLGDSLLKINNNFYNLGFALCNLKDRVSSLIDIRTFFYYGTNSAVNPASGMQDNVTSRPSNTTIENFVNERDELDLIPNSKLNDQVYIIYQKTGFQRNFATLTRTGTTTVNAIGAGSRTISWRINFDDQYNTYSPVFIIWKLIFNNQKYVVQSGFPKFTQAETFSTNLWRNPELWTKQF